jgi:cytosine deaminase
MTGSADILIRNARLRGQQKLCDIAIADGRIASIGAASTAKAGSEIDAKGNLVTPSFVNPHLHLCKVWTLSMMTEEALNAYQGDGMSQALSAIGLASKVKEKYDASWIVPNARRAAALYGTLHIRALADVDSKAKLEGVRALLAVREEFRGIVDIQVVAFAQDGIVRDPGTDKLIA